MKRSREVGDQGYHSQATTPPSPGLGSCPCHDTYDTGTVAMSQNEDQVVMTCYFPPHKEPVPFRSYTDYESHYRNNHLNRCHECRKNFPSEHLLNVHIEECHDPLVAVQREKGERTGCDRKCMTHQKRRMHLIDKHMYPKNFFFGVTKDGIDGRRSMLNDTDHNRRGSWTGEQSKLSRRRSVENDGNSSPPTRRQHRPQPPPVSQPTHKPMSIEEGEEEAEDTDMADLTGAMSALQFVPHSVRFGRGKAGFAKK